MFTQLKGLNFIPRRIFRSVSSSGPPSVIVPSQNPSSAKEATVWTAKRTENIVFRHVCTPSWMSTKETDDTCFDPTSLVRLTPRPRQPSWTSSTSPLCPRSWTRWTFRSFVQSRTFGHCLSRPCTQGAGKRQTSNSCGGKIKKCIQEKDLTAVQRDFTTVKMRIRCYGNGGYEAVRR